MELDGELLFPRGWLNIFELLKAIAKHLISSYSNIDLILAIGLILAHCLLYEHSPEESLAIKVQNFWHFVYNSLELLGN